MEINKTTVNKKLETILELRFHGASNIRGIWYQILYSIFRAFDLYKKEIETSFLRLEGIEDVDLIGLHQDNEYIQVKYSKEPWTWSKLKDPMIKFLTVLRADKNAHFVLAFNFEIKKDIAKLANKSKLSSNDKQIIKIKFRKLCSQINASISESDELLNRLNIVSLPKEILWRKLQRTIAERYNLGSEAVDIYILAIFAQFIKWAKDRKEITLLNLENLRTSIGESLSCENEYQAYGKGLIDRISWQEDKNILDFFEGKGTRSGHIAANVDVKRTIWLERIDKAIKHSRICILRSSSGQGKSALLYRYAFENWDSENTYILRIIKSEEEVEIIRQYLRLKAKLGIPILLLIDNAGWKTKLWPYIAQECASLGFYVLVSIREEDWYRTARLSLTNYEILEPTLDLNEAKEIFKAFKSQNRIHDSVDSAEWAYEKIGKPPLLIEYVYLITHGKMLEERLRDQVKQFSEQNEDPAKVKILRRVSLAHELGSPILVNKLINEIQLRDDPQQVMQSLSEEYLRIEAELIIELHWVRSDHLSKILHEQYPNPALTAISILDAIPSENISNFVSNAISKRGLDTELFMNGLIEKSKDAKIETILAFLDGIFEAGEREFFESNRRLFDEVWELIGSGGPLLLSSAFMPVIKIDMIDELAKLTDKKFANFQKLQEIASRAIKTPRGLDLCNDLLSKVNIYITYKMLQNDFNNLGPLLDWCSLCKVNLQSWKKIKNKIIKSSSLYALSLKEFCLFSQGLYKYDYLLHSRWFLQNQEDIIGFLKLNTDCIELYVSNDELYIEFIPEHDSESSLNDQAISRLSKLRSAVPFCEQYKSQGIWILPLGLKPSFDETHKNIPKKNLPLESDVEKNVVWRKIVERFYLPDSYYRFEKICYELRLNSLNVIKDFSKLLENAFTGKYFNLQKLFEEGQLLERLQQGLKTIPYISTDVFETIGKNLPQSLKKILNKTEPNKWFISYRNFFDQIFQYMQDKDKSTAKLAVHNYLDALNHLPKMHIFFDELFKISPNYFEANKLDLQEIKYYNILSDLLYAWILHPPKEAQINIFQYVRKHREKERKELLNAINNSLISLKEQGIIYNLPTDVYIDYPCRYLTIAFSVSDPIHTFEALEPIIEKLINVKELVQFFCLIPLFDNQRYLKDGYIISSNQISQLEAGKPENWEWIIPIEFPKGIWNYLSPIPYKPYPKYEINIKVQALLIASRNIMEHHNIINNLKVTNNRFEIELYKRCKAKIHQQEKNLGDAVIEVKNYLIAEFSQLKNEKYYKTLFEFLENLIDSIQQNEFIKYIESGKFNSKEINDALDQLIEIN